MDTNILTDLLLANADPSDTRWGVLSPLEVEAIEEAVVVAKRVDNLCDKLYGPIKSAMMSAVREGLKESL